MFKHAPIGIVWLAAIFAFIGTGGFVTGAHEAWLNWQFSKTVPRTIGSVTKLYTTISSGRHGSSTTYHVAYSYLTSDEKRVNTNTSVSPSTYYQLASPGAVPVKYLPREQTTSRIDLPTEDSAHQRNALVMIAVGVVFGGMGWFALVGLERLIFYRHWLRKHGIRCAGHVQRVVTTTATWGKEPVRYLVYTYTDPSGHRREGSSEGLSWKQNYIWSDGDPIEVFCDPRDNSRSAALLNKPLS